MWTIQPWAGIWRPYYGTWESIKNACSESAFAHYPSLFITQLTDLFHWKRNASKRWVTDDSWWLWRSCTLNLLDIIVNYTYSLINNQREILISILIKWLILVVCTYYWYDLLDLEKGYLFTSLNIKNGIIYDKKNMIKFMIKNCMFTKVYFLLTHL